MVQMRIKILSLFLLVLLISPHPMSGGEVSARTALFAVPFTSQAPTGDWGNPVFQDGCEEASILMAHRWARRLALTKTEAARAIKNIAVFERRMFGTATDTSATDTARLMKTYFRYPHVSVRYDVGFDDITSELRRGNILIAPVNGRKLQNPHFRRPGPLYHMLVIRGYDERKGTIIVNDPGTRHGEGYRYSKRVFMGALGDYHTGNHLPIKERRKTVIVVERKPL